MALASRAARDMFFFDITGQSRTHLACIGALVRSEKSGKSRYEISAAVVFTVAINGPSLRVMPQGLLSRRFLKHVAVDGTNNAVITPYTF